MMVGLRDQRCLMRCFWRVAHSNCAADFQVSLNYLDSHRQKALRSYHLASSIFSAKTTVSLDLVTLCCCFDYLYLMILSSSRLDFWSWASEDMHLII